MSNGDKNGERTILERLNAKRQRALEMIEYAIQRGGLELDQHETAELYDLFKGCAHVAPESTSRPSLGATEPFDDLPGPVQEAINAHAKYYAEHHKIGMSIRDDMTYIAKVAMRWKPSSEPVSPLAAPKGSDKALIEKLESAVPMESPQKPCILVPLTLSERDSIVAALKLWWWPATQRSETAASRDAVLEEAANVCERDAAFWSGPPELILEEIAKRIRALKNAP